MLQLLEEAPENSYELDKMRILDFYMVFPSLINAMKMPQSARKYRKHFKSVTSYEDKGNPKSLFQRAEPYQMLAVKYLQALEVIDETQIQLGVICRTKKELPKELRDSISTRTQSMQDVVKFLVEELAGVQLSGDGGLKARTKLMEYQYDT
ncbi:ABC-three component system middle component 5 [Tichowtungia aerotolerans]|uniref:Uncharacterized protein n=1 Tax=Tichowtungia aerotolerans TaxID=2697043 RepID=A0A6P1M4K2_9BACT|nr:ABC-three component system middle component 5 [Tichowtungia aerotolerans]QHI68771.1 hypothetical protein GT409_04675 [Tichowtungia aerotolerans]